MSYNFNYSRPCAMVILTFALLLGLASCGSNQDDNFDATLLYGKWQEGTVFERYYQTDSSFILPSGDTVQANGITWDEGDDISEEEAQIFKWKLNGGTLLQEHISTFVTVPRVYVLSSLTSSELIYRDGYGTTHYFTKVE